MTLLSTSYITCALPGCDELVISVPIGRGRKYCSDAHASTARSRTLRSRQRVRVEHRSKTVEWSTPSVMFEALNERWGPFDLDPCATSENAKCPRFFTAADDGLSREWTGRVFMNPPYGRAIGAWMEKAWLSAQTTAELVVCLVPARVDTRWWHGYAARGEVEFVAGRLKFGGAKHPAPFPSALVVFR